MPQFFADGSSRCVPEVTSGLIEEATRRRATCRKHSPFATGRARIATVTAHFGEANEHYKKAFQTHLLHSLIHGTEVRAICDPIIDNLWNKPAFILNLLMHEMLKPAQERLEWIQWADRDTLILDQCRPISSFLPLESLSRRAWWRPASTHVSEDNSTHLLISNDFNGLNNGVFMLRVGAWAIDLFTAILAFRQYKPGIYLPYTEQSAMEYVLQTPHFKDETRYVPQYWFNAYEHGGPLLYEGRQDIEGMEETHVRRGDYLVHFAGNPDKGEAIELWTEAIDRLGDVWERGDFLRDISEEIRSYWEARGVDT